MKLKSAKPYVKKAIYGIYNVDDDESVDSLTAFVTDICGVEPINCFLVTKKASDEDTSRAPNSFRICIDAQCSEKFLDSMAWPNGIVVKPWKFKPKPKVTEDNIPSGRNGSAS